MVTDVGRQKIGRCEAATIASVRPLAIMLPRRLPYLVRAAIVRLVHGFAKRVPITFIVASPLGFRMRGNTFDVIQRFLWLFGIWEPSLTSFVRSRLRPGDIAVDIGANCGYYTLLFATTVGPNGRVISVEPLEANLHALRRNLDLNGLVTSCIEVRNVALGEVAGEVTMYAAPPSNLGSSSTLPDEGFVRSNTSRVVPTWQLLTEEEWRSARLIKIDVEGDELAVLRGMTPILPLLPPDAAVVIEVSPAMLERRGARPAALLDLLAQHGFSAWTVKNSYRPIDYLLAPTPLARYSGEPVKEATDFVMLREAVK